MKVLQESKHCKLYLAETEEEINLINERKFIMGFLPEGFVPEKIQDSQMSEGFAPIKGKYIAEIEDVTVKEGTWPSGDAYKQLSLKLRIKETIEGDKANNRVIFDQTSLVDTTYDGAVTTAAEHASRLVNKICTAGYDIDLVEANKSEEAFIDEVSKSKGTKCNLSCWVQNNKQRSKIVDKFTNVGKTFVKPEEIPF